MHIVIISNQAFSLINFRGALISDLLDLGNNVTVLAPDFTEATFNQLSNLGCNPVPYTLNRTGLNPFIDFISMIHLTMIFGRIKPDIIMPYFIKPVIYATIAGWISGVKHRVALIEGLGYAFAEDKSANTLKRKVVRLIVELMYKVSLSKANRIIVLNPDDKRLLVHCKLAREDKVVVINGIGVDLKKFEYSCPPIKPITFVFVARMLREKGLFEFIEAAAHLKKLYPEINFKLVGGTDLNPGSITEFELHRLVFDAGVDWIGHVDSIPDVLMNSSVFVLPSFYREGLPRSIQEAMAVGRPIITTDVPGCRETVCNGVNGFIVPPCNVESLFNAMKFFIDSPLIIKKMGLESYRYAKKYYDVKIINQKFISLLLERSEG